MLTTIVHRFFKWRPRYHYHTTTPPTTIITAQTTRLASSGQLVSVFLFINCRFLILTTVIYSLMNGPIRRARDADASWAPVLLLVPASTSHPLPDASLYNPPPTPRPPPPPRKHPRGPNDEMQANDNNNGPKKTSNDDINSRLRFQWVFFLYRIVFLTY